MTAKIEFEGKQYELPVVVGTENEYGIDISTLRGKSGGLITLDAGFKNTGSCESAITFLDGEKGILRHRGYTIEDLAEHSTFLEVRLQWPNLFLKRKIENLVESTVI